jgi:ABC-2 type transport system permease protein
MWNLLQIEMLKIFRKPRTYIGFAAITAIIALVQLAFYVDGRAYMDFAFQSLNQFDIGGNLLNGYFVCYVILQMLLIHVPLLITLVAGDVVAGEANMGTLRLLVAKPVSRSSILMSKFTASVVYSLLLLLWMAILALLLSLLIFGSDDLLVLKSGKGVLLREADVFWRYIAAFGYAGLAMITVASLAFLLSIFAENSIGPIIATMSVIIVFTILTTMELPFFNSIKPFLFTSHMLGWKGFFSDPVNYMSVGKSALILIFHIFLFTGIAIIVFKRKDILS